MQAVATRARRRWTLALAGIAALLTLNAVLFLTQPGLALPRSLANYFFGPGMIRAEVLVQDGSVTHDYRLDQGRIRAVLPAKNTLRLLERDGRLVVIEVSPTARIEMDGRPVTLAQLRRGVRAIVVREGDLPAEAVLAGRR
jgi:hypothetical protein